MEELTVRTGFLVIIVVGYIIYLALNEYLDK
jgi:preprotein translocase subunit Sss1